MNLVIRGRKIRLILIILLCTVLTLNSSCQLFSPFEKSTSETTITSNTTVEEVLEDGQVDRTLNKYSSEVFYGFDTVTRIIGFEENQEAFDKQMEWIESRIRYYHELFTSFEEFPDVTNIYTINQQAASESVKVKPEVFNLLSLAKKMAKESDGAFNPCLGQVTALWREASERSKANPDEAYIPEMKDLKAAYEHSNVDDLVLNHQSMSVSFKNPELKLDVGAIAKGYALELIIDEMAARGVNYYLISMGGNVKSLGKKATGENWVVGVQDPFDSNALYLTLETSDKAVVTSGVYERFFTVGDKQYHHILDPTTMMPSDKYVSVTIIHEDSGLADAFSTALFNLDIEVGRKLADRYGAEVIWILPDGETIEHRK